MTESIEITVNVHGVVRHEGRRWIAGCPKLNVWSQGASKQEAQRCLKEAVELWIEDCLVRGTLDQALREVGFQPAPWGIPLTGVEGSVTVKRTADAAAVLGTDFDLNVSMPAYQATAFLQSQRAG